MKVKSYHTTYDSMLREVGIIFESENAASIQVRMSVDKAMSLGQLLIGILNPTHENDPDPRFGPANNSE